MRKQTGPPVNKSRTSGCGRIHRGRRRSPRIRRYSRQSSEPVPGPLHRAGSTSGRTTAYGHRDRVLHENDRRLCHRHTDGDRPHDPGDRHGRRPHHPRPKGGIPPRSARNTPPATSKRTWPNSISGRWLGTPSCARPMRWPIVLVPSRTNSSTAPHCTHVTSSGRAPKNAVSLARRPGFPPGRSGARRGPSVGEQCRRRRRGRGMQHPREAAACARRWRSSRW